MSRKDYPIIIPKRGRSDPNISPVVVLVFTLEDYKDLLLIFGDSVSLKRDIYNATLLNIDCQGLTFTIVGPIIGAPQAVLIVEKLIAIGAETILAYGWCGSISPVVRVGDLVIPKRAISEEGTSKHYPVDPSKVKANDELVEMILSHLPAGEMTPHVGKVWSTDAPYRELASKVTEYQNRGILAVDMESSALLQVAAFRDIRVGVALLVSDELFTLKWKPGFRSKKFVDNRKLMTNIILGIQKSLLESL